MHPYPYSQPPPPHYPNNTQQPGPPANIHMWGPPPTSLHPPASQPPIPPQKDSPSPSPLCIACKEEEAWYDTARKSYSKYCDADCQRVHGEYLQAITQLKKCQNELPAIISANDLPPPPRCSCPQQGSQVYDYVQKKYVAKCHFCMAPPTPPRPSPQNPLGNPNPHHRPPPSPASAYQQRLEQLQSNPVQLVRTVRKVNASGVKPPPSEAASRVYIKPSIIQDKGDLCNHCFLKPCSKQTNQGLFCSTACEQAEGRVQGCGVLVTSHDFRIIGLAMATSGPYERLWSLFHGTKRPQELARDSCVRIATDMVGPAIAPTAKDKYCMIEHSTPNVFSYTCLVKRDVNTALPPTQDGIVTHFLVDPFYEPLTRDNLKVVDVFGKTRIVSRHTHKVILEWIQSTYQ